MVYVSTGTCTATATAPWRVAFSRDYIMEYARRRFLVGSNSRRRLRPTIDVVPLRSFRDFHSTSVLPFAIPYSTWCVLNGVLSLPPLNRLLLQKDIPSRSSNDNAPSIGHLKGIMSGRFCSDHCIRSRVQGASYKPRFITGQTGHTR
jgi:hypothetical protein